MKAKTLHYDSKSCVRTYSNATKKAILQYGGTTTELPNSHLV